MAQEVFVALFDSLAEAQAASRDLEAAGIASSDITIRTRDTGATVTAAGDSDRPQERGGFLDWLFGSAPSDTDLDYYRAHVESRGGVILSVRADSADYDRIADILEGHDLTKVDETQEMSGLAAVAPPAATVAPQPTAARGTETEAVVPTAREELRVGKQQVQDTRRFRIRRYTVERPVEEQVALRDERVTVERRAAGSAAPGERPFEDKVVEVTETREEPVISKVVRPGEEVVVRKEGQERVETVRDTVRESKVEVDRAAAGDKPSTAAPSPLEREDLRDEIKK